MVHTKHSERFLFQALAAEQLEYLLDYLYLLYSSSNSSRFQFVRITFAHVRFGGVFWKLLPKIMFFDWFSFCIETAAKESKKMFNMSIILLLYLYTNQ